MKPIVHTVNLWHQILAIHWPWATFEPQNQDWGITTTCNAIRFSDICCGPLKVKPRSCNCVLVFTGILPSCDFYEYGCWKKMVWETYFVLVGVSTLVVITNLIYYHKSHITQGSQKWGHIYTGSCTCMWVTVMCYSPSIFTTCYFSTNLACNHHYIWL